MDKKTKQEGNQEQSLPLPSVMRGVQLIATGPEHEQDPSTALVHRQDLPLPCLAKGAPDSPREVLIRVKAAGVNNTDINTRIGWYDNPIDPGDPDAGNEGSTGGYTGKGVPVPLIQGADLCGVVVRVSHPEQDSPLLGARVIVEPCHVTEIPEESSCSNYKNKQKKKRKTSSSSRIKKVYTYLGSDIDGAFAQYCKVSSRFVHVINQNCPLSDVQLAAVPCSYSTAANLLHRSRAGEGDAVLITGASGGVGLAAVLIAKLKGCWPVIAIASGSKSAEIQRVSGADYVLDRTKVTSRNLLQKSLEDISQACGLSDWHVDVVIDIVGGPDQFPSLIHSLKDGQRGRLATSGAIAGAHVTVDLREIYLRDITIYGCTGLGEECVFRDLVGWLNQGLLRPVVWKTYPLEELVAAQKAFLEKRHVGKIVLEVG
eukprot:Nk52_evm1s2081 gene=Nk52_evmTU1s2081